MTIDINQLIQAYYHCFLGPHVENEQVIFGTSGHRGSSLINTFNEHHILAITQAICWYRKQQGITGPLFLGIDTHALSKPAYETALEVFIANGVNVRISVNTIYTPTPAISHAILQYNLGRSEGFADGVVITSSHNPPQDGGIKYNPPSGGPASQAVTDWIELKANEFLKCGLTNISRIPYERASKSDLLTAYDYLQHYVSDLINVVDLSAIHQSHLQLGVDPMGGAGVEYWARIAEYYRLDLTITEKRIDPTFSFIPNDWDGQIRMDPSSSLAMQNLLTKAHQFDVCVACDADHDRHGVVTKEQGLMPANDYLATAAYYLLSHRKQWSSSTYIAKTLVTTTLLDRIAHHFNHSLLEKPVGFKWFVDGLLKNQISFVGEESAGGTFARFNETVWTTDKDGIVMSLLAAEMTAVLEKNPAELFATIKQLFGQTYFKRVDCPTDSAQKNKLKKMTTDHIKVKEMARSKIIKIQTEIEGLSFGGIKIHLTEGWMVLRSSGTENICKIYAESFQSVDHLNELILAAKKILVDLS